MLRGIGDNPVVTKELRGRMRGARTYWLLFGYLLLLSLILFFSYLGWWNSHSNAMETGGASAGFTVGRDFFKILFYSQAVMIALITPALTAGAISVEREQRTFEMLRGTILRPGSIVWGKLFSSVSLVALLLTSSLPLLSLCFLLGGVSPGEVFFAYLLLIADAFLFGAIGLCWSAYAANTATATVLSYGTLILFFAVTFPFAIPALSPGVPNFGLEAVNPIGAITGAVQAERYYGWTLPAWLPALLLNGTLMALLILAAVNRLEDFPTRRAAPLRLTMLLFAGLLVFFGDGIVVGAGPATPTMLFALFLALSAIVTVLLLLFVPVLVTGDLEGWPERRGWSPLRVFGNATLSSGLPLALLLTVTLLGLTLIALHLSPGPIGFSAGPTTGLSKAASVSASMTVTIADVTDGILQASAMLVTLVVAIAGTGYLLSVALGNRWASLTLLYLALILAVALPFFSYGLLTGREAAAALGNPAINLLYLCPAISLVQISDNLHPGHLGIGHDDVVRGLVGYGACPLWVGTSAAYSAVGLASYAAAFVLLRRRRNPMKTA